MKPITLIVFWAAFVVAGCSGKVTTSSSGQSEKDALTEMCTLPKRLHSQLAEIGPYLAQRISNPTVTALLSTLEGPEGLNPILEKHGFDPKKCDLITAVNN